MPIDPRIALGVEPFKTPDFLNFAAQAANIRQSQAAEQNALALMAQRQREEQEAMNVTNALRGFNPSDPNARNRLYQIPGGAAAYKAISEAEAASTGAAKAAREEQSAARESIMSKLSAYRNPLEMYASLQQAKAKGVLDDLSYTSLTNSLRQHIRRDPVGGLEAFKDEVAFGRLSPEQRLETQTVTQDTGVSILGFDRRKYGPPGAAFTPTFEIPKELSQAERIRIGQDQAKLEADLAKINQDMAIALENQGFKRDELAPITGMPGMFRTAQGTVVAPTFSAPDAAPEAEREKDGVYAVNTSGLNGVPVLEAQSAMNARSILRSVGYGASDFDKLISTIKRSPSGIGAKTYADAQAAVSIPTAEKQALAKLEVISSQLTFAALQGKLGSGVSNIDVELINRLSGDIKDPSKTVADRLSAFEQFIDVMRRVAYLPNDGYNPFTGRGAVKPDGGSPGRRNLGVTTAPAAGQGTVRAPVIEYVRDKDGNIVPK